MRRAVHRYRTPQTGEMRTAESGQLRTAPRGLLTELPPERFGEGAALFRVQRTRRPTNP